MNLSYKIAVTLALTLLMAFSCPLFQHVSIVHASEPYITTVLAILGFNNVTPVEIETFPRGAYNITLYAKLGGYNPDNVDLNELSYYETNTSSFNVLFTPSEPTLYGYVTPPISKNFSAIFQFALSLLSWNNTRYYTQTALNPDGLSHAQVYVNDDDPSMLLIGFDERSYCSKHGDADFNDMVISLQMLANACYLNVVSAYDTPTNQGWYINGTNAFASLADGIVDHGNGTRRVFAQWSTDASGNNYTKSDPILMNQNKTALAVWNTEHHLTVKTVPNGLTTIPGENWYTQGTNKVLTAPEVAGYAFTNWDVDGIPQSNGTKQVTVTMNAPHTASAHYVKTYSLTIEAGPGGTTSPTGGTYSYSEGSLVQVTANPSLNYKFDHWELDGIGAGSINPYIVAMNGNHTLKAVFKDIPPPSVSISPLNASIFAGQSVTFHSNTSGGTPPYSYQWYLDGKPVSGATSDSWTFTPGTIGTSVRYVYLIVADQGSKSAQSETARIEVSFIPVGGYTISPNRRATVNPQIIYVGLVVGLALFLVSVRRKTRKRVC